MRAVGSDDRDLPGGADPHRTFSQGEAQVGGEGRVLLTRGFEGEPGLLFVPEEEHGERQREVVGDHLHEVLEPPVRLHGRVGDFDDLR